MLFPKLIKTGENGLKIKRSGRESILEWTDIVGANKLFGFIFLRNGEAVFISKTGDVKVLDYGDRDIGEGESSVHLGWTKFVEILKKNVVAHGGTFIDEFEGLYVSLLMASPMFSSWDCKVSPEEAKDRKVLIIYFFIAVFYLVSALLIQLLGFGGEQVIVYKSVFHETQIRDIWPIALFVMHFCVIFFGLFYLGYYLRMGKAFKILERHNVPIKRD